MNIYKLSQNINDDYNTYDSCVVCAENEEEARLIHPSWVVTHCDNENWYGTDSTGKEYKTEDDYPIEWVKRKDVDKIEVEYIGKAKKGMKKGVILASFNAG